MKSAPESYTRLKVKRRKKLKPEVEPKPIVSQCSCGRSYDLFDWLGLKCIGAKDYSPEKRLEFRNCPCGSTITADYQDSEDGTRFYKERALRVEAEKRP